ncbi:hypothetical protein A3H22_01570 [Candidatus Peribacteria bacterium RIFCSPLOWO2_12_FULL_55_15]|nr:MAG: hypothetical protein A3E47_02365 [Candidatus Peribacteria bacterium RIFCSPHIGHO2_12_FULL_54_10]OGJ72257.1 MAG: hypothetical protein A3H22_01570 [Candidatus Peribacteria bacterium RIFCSPLOWO2_12_FULL_55_15]
MTDRKENERPEEAKDNEPDLRALSRRRVSLVAEFQTYMHITFDGLSLASHEETEALRTPLLQMELTEEDIGAWEHFRAFLPKLLNAAQALHVKIDDLLRQAADDRLLDSNDIAAWHAFFRSASIDFQGKKRGAEELARNLSQKMQNTDEHPPKKNQEHQSEKNILKRDQDVEQRPQETRAQEKNEKNTPQETLEKREEYTPQKEPLSLLRNTQTRTRWLLTLLPSQISPLYTAAAKRGSTALHAVQKTLEQSLVRQNFGFLHRKDTIILTAEKLRNTEESLATCQASAAQNEEAKTVILEPISLASQSVVVHGIHQTLLENIKTLEKYGMQGVQCLL